MFIVGLLSWWYGAGWKVRFLMVRERLARSIDYFSINLLIRTLFSPFRQISAGRVSGPIGVKWRAFVDRLISRVIGSMVRSVLILVGTTWLIVQTMYGAVMLILWAFVPLMPLIGFVIAIAGWAPSWT